ncbi:MAG: TIR domain-containing protein [Coriobacteriia bacterium]|nr:TIR domain-containing protein [Coriobacteriia bacterium]
MSVITDNEKEYFISLFNRGGYVLNFSTSSFDAFTTNSVGVPLCARYQLSKGKSFAAFIREASQLDVHKLVKDMMEYYEVYYQSEIEFINGTADNQFDNQQIRMYRDLYRKCKEIISRLDSTKAPKPSDNISAFVSYSHDSEEHIEWVMSLSSRLRYDGINVCLDRWSLVPGAHIPSYMEAAIRENDFVIIICTPNYKKKSDSRRGGVGYESNIISAEVFANMNHEKFIPVIRGNSAESIPTSLAGKLYINLSGNPYLETEYKALASTLLGKRNTAPPIGEPLSTIRTAGNI